jgi:xanthine dehydrogenase accessory factor
VRPSDLADAEAVLQGRTESYVRATVVWTHGTVSTQPGDKAIITSDGRLRGWVGGSCAEPVVVREALRALAEAQPRLLYLGPPGALPAETGDIVDETLVVAPLTCVSEGTLQVFLEPWRPPTHIVAIGRAPLVRTLVAMAGALGFDAAVVEREEPDRAELDGLDVPVVADLDLAKADVRRDTYVVIATMGRYDEDALQAALETDAMYVALVASERRAASVLESVRAAGVPEARLAQVRCPAGLDLGPLPHEEIAVAILAEIVQHKAHAAPVAAPKARTEESPTAVDPVCGMSVTVSSAAHQATVAGATYWFCCAGCRRRFEQDPEPFTQTGS